MQSSVKNILCDLGNVLYTLDIDLAYANLASLVKPGILEEQVQEVILKFEIGEISTSLFLNGILWLCPYTVQARDVIMAWNSMLIELPKRNLDALEKLKDRLNLYLLSNNNELHYEHMQTYLEKEYSLINFNDRYFHSTFYSHLIQCRKPDPEAYIFVQKETGIIPEETLFIDDSYENIASANSLGYQTLLFHPGSDFSSLLLELNLI